MGWKTLFIGEQAIFHNRSGRAKIIDGPDRRLVWFGEKYTKLTKYTADQSQYLKVYYKDGCVEHVQGPHALFLNPLEHESISVEKGVTIDANEALVVYRQGENGKATRLIQRGPTVYILQANEWLHEFSWHGSERKKPDWESERKKPKELMSTMTKLDLDWAISPSDPRSDRMMAAMRARRAKAVKEAESSNEDDSEDTEDAESDDSLQFYPEDGGESRLHHPDDPGVRFRKVADALKFTKLRIIPDQFYLNVDDVRTRDEALITVKLMIFYELEDIEIMLANTEDPIADFMNGLTADVVVFAAQLTYEEFMEQAEKLNDLAVYPQLMEMVKKIGYKVSKVVFRGYHASSQLTKMHEMAIKTRTELRIEMETEEQQEELKDMELKSELERSEMEQNLQIEQEKHKIALKKQKEEASLKIETKKQMEKNRQLREDLEARKKIKKKEDDQLLEHLEKLHSMDVDITQYLLSRNPQPAKVVRVVAPDNNKAAIHFHQTD
ncbi:calponin homology domain-containing protein DDB_G0272472-like [Ptychodera flava]|uniref:calponin homology domain-containing protein DDB_G0272472-like n=1 Tax=Ptychodera flava TaxID=63121 RepID=UPI00396AA155